MAHAYTHKVRQKQNREEGTVDLRHAKGEFPTDYDEQELHEIAESSYSQLWG